MSKVLLVILDGWGHSDFNVPPWEGNAPEQAHVPCFRALYDHAPRTRLACSGLDVGLPEGQMGNSEVGHMNLGAGRVIYQDIARIDKAIADGEFGPALNLDGTVARLRASGKALHLIGLVSDGGVHSHIRHLEALLGLLPEDLDVRIHCITDGRDTSPTGGAGFVGRIADLCDVAPGWSIATVSGRYFTMDRDKRWERTEKGYRAIVEGRSDVVEASPRFLDRRYADDVTDEFVPPVVIAGAGERGIQDGDAVILFNFRADRMRQLVTALTVPGFDGFPARPPFEGVTTLTQYEAHYPVDVAFPPKNIEQCLGEVVSERGLEQLRVAETEKYAHVTYFFNGGLETPYPGEERSLVPSPKVATYDLQPEMSAAGVAAEVAKGMESGAYDFILVNFANPDMVGHTGVIPAAVRAVEAVDGLLGEILDRVNAADGEWVALVTADHGNCEMMLTPEGMPHTAHTTEPVDFFVVDPSGRTRLTGGPGRLADVAPSVLACMGIPQPAEMTGASLVTVS
ncbi:MAG TPA: 2,3-bisphosphoglycerate-independent phosphoglycerate mutase [Longimicrobiales bacterium]|nr:2,3-bisphosphoglycerate-independent phosphoglycerate mutase [Longimicrobiales bacterium]